MAGLVAENFGIAIMPEIPILSQLDVDVVPLRNQDQQRYIYMAQGKEKYHPPLVQKVCRVCKKAGNVRKSQGHPGKISENRSLEEGKEPHREVPSFFL